MSSASNVMTESQPRSEPIGPVAISWGQRLYWSVARELWENRSIYLAPLIVAAVFLAGFFIGLIWLPERIRAALALGPMEQHEAIARPYLMVALVLMFVDLLIAVFYCLDALYGERRDRSILFWKSLPVSDLTTVLAKATIPILVLPLVTFAVTVVTQFVMLVVSGAVLAASGIDTAALSTSVPFFKTSLINLFHLVVVHGLWYAPFFGWLLMVSAWAKRVPFLWATLPPVAIGIVEKMAFNTSYFGATLRHHFMGAPDVGAPGGGMTMDMLMPDSLGQFLAAPGLWTGLALTAVFLVVAIRLRRLRGAI
jgi:ABC-2 type transport system permease protein